MDRRRRDHPAVGQPHPDVDPVPEPVGLRRSDGTSVYRHTGRDHYSSRRVLEAEQRIVALAGRHDALAWSPDDVALAVLAAAVKDIQLNQGQEALVHAMATSGARAQLALAPAARARPPRCGCWPRCGARAAVGRWGWPVGCCGGRTRRGDGDAVRDARQAHPRPHAHPTSSLVSSIGSGTLVVVDEAAWPTR
ncbi:hypothetical protein NKG05_25950 [Oerskovia sp. M15]